MAGKRKDNPLDLPARTYYRNGAFYYQHPKTVGGKLERLGTDICDAKKKGDLYNDVKSGYGTIAYWLDRFIVHCESRVGLSKEQKGLARRTFEDYAGNVEYLKQAFGAMEVTTLMPYHVGKYLEIMRSKNRAVRANREKSCLSACYTWLLLQEESGVRLNPCAGIKRNPESKRTRYVTDDELAVLMRVLRDAPLQSKGSAKAVRALMMLVYRTLQRPEDILGWTAENIIEMNGKRVIRSQPNKLKGRTNVVVHLEVTPDVEEILIELNVDVNSKMPMIHRRDGHQYTYSGLNAIMQRYRTKAQKLRLGMEPFGFYDMKAKGATDMAADGVPLELIQHLAGHASKTTTEIYLKGRQVAIAAPNSRKLMGTE